MATKKSAASLASAVKGGKKNVAKPNGKALKSSGSWSARGWDVAGEELKRREIEQAERENDVRRFWLKDGGETNIIFVDSDPFCIHEHNLQVNGKWGHYKTCLASGGEKCPFCEADSRDDFIAYFTVIDKTEYKGKDGKTYKNQIRAYPSKAETLKILRKLSEKNGNSLTGIEFEVSRTGDKSPRVGNMFTPVKRHNLKDPKVYKALGFNAPPKSIDWEAKLAPLSREDALSWLGGKLSDAADDVSSEEVNY